MSRAGSGDTTSARRPSAHLQSDDRTHRVRDLARLISEETGVEIAYLDIPRIEAVENNLHVANDFLLSLDLEPIKLSGRLRPEVTEIA